MEPSNAVYFTTPALGLIALITLYFFGVWSRSYIMPSHKEIPLRKHFVASVPAGLLTMGVYAKSAFPALESNPSGWEFEVAIMAGYAIVFGMMSRETLERLLETRPPAPAAPPRI